MDRILADCRRVRSADAANRIGKWLKANGQFAIGVKSGGEAVATAVQIKMEHNKYTVTIFCDASNAFCRCDPEITTVAIIDTITELLALTDPSVWEEFDELVEAFRYVLSDLVWSRTYDGRAASVVDGVLKFFGLPGGEVGRPRQLS